MRYSRSFAHSLRGLAIGVTVALAISTPSTAAGAQTPERRTLTGNDIAVYNIAGVMRVGAERAATSRSK